MSTDGCNTTTRKTPCAAGGRLDLYASPALRGAKAAWRYVGPMFTTNTTASGDKKSPGAITREFVTSGYFGGVPGDPDGGKTRVVTQNNAGPTFWVGQQANGGEFTPYWDTVGAVGHYDYGSLTMARTLGSDPNQVAVHGRRVLVGWIGGGSPASQSLARDLSLSQDRELLQQFVPELGMLRIPGSYRSTMCDADEVCAAPAYATGMQLEVIATFSWPSGGSAPTTPFGVNVLESSGGDGASRLSVTCASGACTGG
eukprot:gene55639-17919_t